jgi:TRAP-type C4-dicarboxylate transport system permease small subunit
MKKFLSFLDRIIDWACVIIISVAFLITLAHIIGRYILRAPIFFSEELARYCFVWSSMLGAVVVHRNDEHTNVTYFTLLIPKKGQKILYILRQILIIVLLCGLMYYGVILSIKMRTVLTAAMEISWALVYSALPVASFFLIISSFRLMVRKIKEPL